MKKFVFILTSLLLVLLTACHTGNRLTKEEMARQVRTSIEERHFTIAVDWMRPYGGMPQHVNSNYELKINDDELDSYLPYVGEAYHVPYGGGKGLNFKAQIRNYSATFAGNKGYIVECDVPNDEDVFYYRINIFNSGKAIIDVWARDRNPISFQGEMVF